MNEYEQEPEFYTFCKIIVKSVKRIEIQYERIAKDSKKYGHMNDFQIYESLSPITTVKFLKSKNLKPDDDNVRYHMQTMSLKSFETAIRYIKRCYEEGPN